MKIIVIFFILLLNKFNGYCSSTEDDSDDSSTSSTSPSDDNRLHQIPVENVQLTKYIDDEIIELPQQDFFKLRQDTLQKKILFRDPQFPEESFLLSEDQVLLRPRDIVQDSELLVFYDEHNKKFHIKQGNLGNCWFLVGLLHLEKYMSLFKFIVQPDHQSFKENYAGIFHFRFWQAGTWVDVVVDDRLVLEPDEDEDEDEYQYKELFYAYSGHTKEFWLPLIEKAYAKLIYQSYEKLRAGYPAIAMQDLTGCIIETFMVDESKTYLFNIFQHSILKKTMMTCTSNTNDQMKNHNEMNEFGLEPSHAYAITGVKLLSGKYSFDKFKVIRLRDPSGTMTYRPHLGNIINLIPENLIKNELKINVAGELWILFEDFIKYIESVDICNLTPNNPITNDVYSYNGNEKLVLSAIQGKWIGGINMNEAKFESIYNIFPQYLLRTTIGSKGKLTCEVLIGLSLKRRDDLVPIYNTPMRIQIIHVNNNHKVSKPMKNLKYKKIKSEITEISNGQLSVRVKLNAFSNYYIIPYVGDTFKGATFFLQILSEQTTILEEYDQDINMPNFADKFKKFKLPFVETNDQQLFLNVEKDQTIDFKNLYDILKDKRFSLNKIWCDAAVHKIDDSIISELELISVTKNVVINKKLSISKIIMITSLYQEIFEMYEDQRFPGHIHYHKIILAFKEDGYSMDLNILRSILSLFVDENGLVNFKNFMLIVFTIKSKIGSYCVELSAKLCQNLILMVNNDIYKSKNFDESIIIHDLRIDIFEFKTIIEFIRELKAKFLFYSSKTLRTVIYENFKNILEGIYYKLPYKLIEMVFYEYRNKIDIFFYQFVELIVDITQIFKKIQGLSLNENIYDLFSQYWKNKNDKKKTIENKRKANSAWKESAEKKKKRIKVTFKKSLIYN